MRRPDLGPDYVIKCELCVRGWVGVGEATRWVRSVGEGVEGGEKSKTAGESVWQMKIRNQELGRTAEVVWIAPGRQIRSQTCYYSEI